MLSISTLVFLIFVNCLRGVKTDINVAIHYAGCNKGKQLPTVFKIGVGAINRGASLEFCSQYPGEVILLSMSIQFSYFPLPVG